MANVTAKIKNGTIVTKRGIDIAGFQNVEAIVAPILKEETYARLVSVNHDNGRLILTFESDTTKARPNYVKQVSKKRYSSIDVFIEENYDKLGTLVAKIDLPKMW